MISSAEPEWLTKWRTGALSRADALARFDSLPGVKPEEMRGRWRGAPLPTGHPLDGVLENLGWYGKAFESVDDVRPLLFRSRRGEPVALCPALMPVGVALRWPGLARHPVVRACFSALRPLLRARRPSARLRSIEFRGKSSAAMVYDHRPIIDHFRGIDERSVLGCMDMRDVPPFFFLLVRDDLNRTDFDRTKR